MTSSGLCEHCRFCRRVPTRYGTGFLLCRRSAADPSFERYPRLPVLDCRGFEARDEARPAADLRPPG